MFSQFGNVRAVLQLVLLSPRLHEQQAHTHYGTELDVYMRYLVSFLLDGILAFHDLLSDGIQFRRNPHCSQSWLILH